MGRRADRVDLDTIEVLSEIEDEHDARVCWAAVKHRIESLRKAGREVPEELLVAERQLMTELVAESQGR